MEMQKKLSSIACRRLYTPDRMLEDVLVEFEGRNIARVGHPIAESLPQSCFDARDDGLTVVPGLVDSHIHGCGGCSFLDTTRQAIDTICRTAARGGATSVVATTTVPVDDNSLERFSAFVELVRSKMRDDDAFADAEADTEAGARVLGVFLEGPFLRMEKRGGYGTQFVQPVDLDLARRILEISGDILLKMTIAPEIRGADELIDLLLTDPSTKVEITLGHTGADSELAQRCFARERVRQVTHTFNAMNGLHHRSPSLIAAAMLDPEVICEIVPDGFHLTGPIIEILYRLKGSDHLVVITDGTTATATPPGTFVESVGNWTRIVDGVVRTADGTIAGSGLQMMTALRSGP